MTSELLDDSSIAVPEQSSIASPRKVELPVVIERPVSERDKAKQSSSIKGDPL
jgi:hypothetical protein